MIVKKLRRSAVFLWFCYLFVIIQRGFPYDRLFTFLYVCQSVYSAPDQLFSCLCFGMYTPSESRRLFPSAHHTHIMHD